MSDLVKPMAEWSAAIVEAIGLSIIVLMSLSTVARAALGVVVRRAADAVFERARQTLGRGILLGLEFLVAADIIHTVAVDLSFTSVGVLAIIVAIRTFLSFTLEVELTGRWPWQQEHEPSSS